jgi:hypothetical protein
VGVVVAFVAWLMVTTITDMNRAVAKGNQEARRIAATYPKRGPWNVIDRMTAKSSLLLQDAKGDRESIPIFNSHLHIREYLELREKDELNLEYSPIRQEERYSGVRSSLPESLIGFFLIPHRIRK